VKITQKNLLTLLSTRFHLRSTFIWYVPSGGISNANFMFWIGFIHIWCSKKDDAAKKSPNFLHSACDAIGGLTPNTMKSKVRVWDHVSQSSYQVVQKILTQVQHRIPHIRWHEIIIVEWNLSIRHWRGIYIGFYHTKMGFGYESQVQFCKHKNFYTLFLLVKTSCLLFEFLHFTSITIWNLTTNTMTFNLHVWESSYMGT